MRKIERIKKNIEANKSIMKALKADEYYSVDRLISDIQCYINAVKTGRILYTVMSVANSGMSRCVSIKSCEKSGSRFYYRQYNCMLKALGYSIKRGYEDTVRVNGCGMNMLFATNYNLMHTFKRLGFISDKVCAELCQRVN